MNKEKQIIDNVVIKGSTFAHCPENYEGEYTIPDEVTAIEPYAFRHCIHLQSVVIPNSVQHIGHHAFEGCTEIEEIQIPIGVDAIEEGTFLGCVNLAYIAIPPSVHRIEKDAFRGCSQLEMGDYDYCYDYIGVENDNGNIIPSSVEFIGDNAFHGCSSIEHMTIPYNVKTIRKNAFSGCRNLKKVQIFATEVSIGEDVFSGCRSLHKIIASSIAAIWPYLSPKYQQIQFEPMFTDELEFLDEPLQDLYSYDGTILVRCSKHATEYTIPQGVEEIANNAFAGCSVLERVHIPNSITHIGVGAFSGCSNLKFISLPDSVASIGQNVFYRCDELNQIYVSARSREKYEKLLPKHGEKLIELKGTK